eukprot:1926867-Pleurochrysis_carterae.AAC.2
MREHARPLERSSHRLRTHGSNDGKPAGALCMRDDLIAGSKEAGAAGIVLLLRPAELPWRTLGCSASRRRRLRRQPRACHHQLSALTGPKAGARPAGQKHESREEGACHGLVKNVLFIVSLRRCLARESSFLKIHAGSQSQHVRLHASYKGAQAVLVRRRSLRSRSHCLCPQRSTPAPGSKSSANM